MSQRAQALADRIAQGGRELAAFAESLSDKEWEVPCKDGRSVGTLLHHVAFMYPIEADVAKRLASGETISDVTWPVVHGINAGHSRDHKNVSRSETVALLRANSAAASEALRGLTDSQLDFASPIPLNGGAVLTTQYFIEQHPIGHPFHHLMSIKEALGR